MHRLGKGILSFGAVAYFVFAIASGCGTFTVLSHPEVEVMDPSSKKFYFEEVTFASNCASCHEGTPDKFGIYSKLELKEPLLATGQGRTSYEKIISEINQNSESWNNGAEFDAVSIYGNTPFLSFYLLPWWYQSGNIQSSEFENEFNEAAIENRAKETRRQSFRRTLGRLRVETEVLTNFQNGASIRANGTMVQAQGQGMTPSMVAQWPSLIPDSSATSPSSGFNTPSASPSSNGAISTNRRTAPDSPEASPPTTVPVSAPPVSGTPPAAVSPPAAPPTQAPAPQAPATQPTRGSESKEGNSSGRASGRRRN